MNDNEKVVIVPWNGEGWTSVGDSDEREKDYIGFVLPNQYAGDDPAKQVMGQWDENDIAKWAKGNLDTTLKEMQPNIPAEVAIARYRALIHELSIIVFDNVVKSHTPQPWEMERWAERVKEANQPKA